MRILRVLRGIVKTALTWAAIWAPVTLIPVGLAAVVGFGLPARILVPLLVSQAVVGAINGAAFATVVAIAGRRKSFETLSLPWIATCGAVGGVVVPVLGRAVLFAIADVPIPAMALVSTFVTNAVLGAGFAATTLTIARRAPAWPRGDGGATQAIGAGAA